MVRKSSKGSAKERAFAKRAEQFCRSIDRAFAADNCPFSLEQAREIQLFRDRADHLRWAHPVEVKRSLIEPTHRLSAMFSGPLYTDEAYPWPHEKKGTPFEPICQVDLAIPSELSGTFFGDGLLQLWIEDSTEGRLRLIPREHVQESRLTPPPPSATNHVWPNPKAFELFEQRSTWTHGYTVSAIRPPVLTIPDTLVSAFDELPSFVGQRLAQAFAKMEQALQDEAVVGQHPGEIGFFGNFSTIQYDSINHPETLLIMESGEIFMWGDHGNAQIFYEPNKAGAFDFSFEWSCC